jgi:hypothetical protein
MIPGTAHAGHFAHSGRSGAASRRSFFSRSTSRSSFSTRSFRLIGMPLTRDTPRRTQDFVSCRVDHRENVLADFHSNAGRPIKANRPDGRMAR